MLIDSVRRSLIIKKYVNIFLCKIVKYLKISIRKRIRIIVYGIRNRINKFINKKKLWSDRKCWLNI